jgi:putative transferase (TIGR04331 family)
MSLNRLIIGPIPSDYSPESDIVLSPHSFIGQEDKYPNWADLGYPAPQFDQGAFLRFTDTFLNGDLFLEIMSYLNEKHGVAYESPFWRTLVMPFVLELWGVMSSCFLTLIPAFEQYQADYLRVDLIDIVGDWDFVDMIDFNLRGLKSPLFTYWLFSQICQMVSPDKWRCHVTMLSIDRPAHLESVSDNTNRRFHGVEGFREIQRDLLSWVLTLKSFVKKTKPPIETFPYYAASENNVFHSLYWCGIFESKFTALFREVLFANLPKTVTVNFGHFQKRALKQRYHRGAMRVIRTSYYYHEQIKFYMAYALSAGEIVVGSQHGGSYGIDRYHYSSFELEIKNRWFVTWGWGSQEGVSLNLLAMSSPICSRYWNQYKQTSSAIVFVSTQVCPLSLGCLYSELFGQGWIDYVQRKYRFLQALSSDKKDRLLYRPHPGQQGALNEIPGLKVVCPSLQLCTGNFKPWMMGAALLVMDNMSTTLNFIVPANVPFILFLSPDMVLSREASVVFDSFRDAGILYDTPEHAAEFINNLSDISLWWATPTVQNARQSWMHVYARPEKHVFWNWVKALWRL